MKEPSSDSKDRESLRQQVIGLGEKSFRKNYYSDLKHSRLELQRFRAVLEDIPDMIIILNREGIILDLNKTAIRVLKSSRVQLVGQSISKIQSLDFPRLNAPDSERIILEEEVGEGEQKETVSRMMYLREVPLEQETLYIIIGRDVSLLIKAEKELLSLNQNLEETVAERTFQLQNNLHQLKSAQQQLINSEKMALMGELVAGVAHEINTPLGIGVTASSALWNKVDEMDQLYRDGDMTEEVFHSFLEYLKESSGLILVNMQRASELIQSFKRVAVDQSSDVVRYIDFGSYLKDVVRSLKPQWKKYKVEILESRRVEIETTPGVWSQILSNLILNSINHGFKTLEKPGEILISYAQLDKELELIYQDNGTGIPDEHLDKIFEPFFTTSRHEGGSGLGMHIVYNLITYKLKGRIAHFRPEGGGAGFRITVPMEHADHSSAEHPF